MNLWIDAHISSLTPSRSFIEILIYRRSALTLKRLEPSFLTVEQLFRSDISNDASSKKKFSFSSILCIINTEIIEYLNRKLFITLPTHIDIRLQKSLSIYIHVSKIHSREASKIIYIRTFGRVCIRFQ